MACNPPESAIKSPQEYLQLIAHMVDVEKGLAGITPLAVIDCPDCKREQPPPPAPQTGSVWSASPTGTM